MEHHRLPVARNLRAAGEVVIFVLAFLTVWPFGSTNLYWKSYAGVGVALLCLIWAANGLITRQFRIHFDAITLALGGMLILSAFQLIPLPIGLVRIVSPSAVRLHERLQPTVSEQFSGEAAVPRPTAIPLSVDVESTRNFAIRLTAIILIYAAVRNWVATRESLKRMAWAGMIVGVLLSLFAIGQLFSGPPGTIYWSIPLNGSFFGPFINRNHYVDYVALCMGWTLALLLVQKNQDRTGTTHYAPGPLDFLTKPVALAAGISLGLMSLSVLFSLSRGGLIAVFLASLAVWFGLLNSTIRRVNRMYILIFLVALGGGLLYFGIGPLEDRFLTIRSSSMADDRLPLWRGALSQVPGFYLFGSGNGTFTRVEPLARPQTDQPYVEYTNAHNEYVEALLEGGIVRLLLIGILVFALVFQLGRAYRRRAERIVGPYLLGCWFGLFAVAAHAVTDFGIHIPAVAMLAAVTAGYAMAAGQDAEFGLHRKRNRKKVDMDSFPTPAIPSVADSPQEKEKPVIFVGGLFAIALALLIAATGLAVGLDIRNYARFYEYWLAGKRMGRPADPALIERKIALLNAAVALRPQESNGHLELGKARIQASLDLSELAREAVVGSMFPRTGSSIIVPSIRAEYLEPGLRDLRTARNLNALYPETQLLLGQHRRYFSEAEPSIVYFERAKVLNVSDPNIWFACGNAEAEAGRDAEAFENWKHSLEISPQQLPAILAEAGRRYAAGVVLNRILPGNPVTLVEAADYYRGEPDSYRLILERAASAPVRGDWIWKHRVAVAEANEALGRYAEADAAWAVAVAADPIRYEVRDGAARFLEREERYEEALSHLVWLMKTRPGDNQTRERILFVKHGLNLSEALKE